MTRPRTTAEKIEAALWIIAALVFAGFLIILLVMT